MRGGASMRFHPKSLASSDQRPGPNMASAAAIVAVNRLANGSPLDVAILQISITATADSSQRGPQPRDQKQSRSREGREGERRKEWRSAPQLPGGTHEEDGADHQAHEQQPDAGPAAGKCGIEPSQHAPSHDYSLVAAPWRPPVGSRA